MHHTVSKRHFTKSQLKHQNLTHPPIKPIHSSVGGIDETNDLLAIDFCIYFSVAHAIGTARHDFLTWKKIKGGKEGRREENNVCCSYVSRAERRGNQLILLLLLPVDRKSHCSRVLSYLFHWCSLHD